MTSKLRRTALFFAPFVFATVTACSSDNVVAPPPGSNKITDTEQTEIEESLKDPTILAALFGSEVDPSDALVLELMSTHMQNIGTLNINIASPAPVATTIPGIRQTVLPPRLASEVPSTTFKAFAGKIVLTLKDADGSGTEKMIWMGMVALNDLSNPTKILVAGISQESVASVPSSMASTPFAVDRPTGSPKAEASYAVKDGSSFTLYEAVNGQMAITQSSFGSSKSCNFSGFAALQDIPSITVTGCNASQGSMKGNFNFTANQSGGGSGTVSISLTTFSLPASLSALSVTVDESGDE